MKLKVEVQKCYFVAVTDEDGNELVTRYVFGDRQEALNTGRSLKASDEVRAAYSDIHDMDTEGNGITLERFR